MTAICISFFLFNQKNQSFTFVLFFYDEQKFIIGMIFRGFIRKKTLAGIEPRPWDYKCDAVLITCIQYEIIKTIFRRDNA